MSCGIPKPQRVKECSTPEPPSGERERERIKRNERDEKAFFLPKIGTTLQMKILHLEGCDKIEEKIALEAFKTVSPAYLPVPLTIADSVFC